MRYYSIMRPIGPGTIPKKQVKMIKNFDKKVFCDEIGRDAWGYVEFGEPLTEKEADSYELVPEGIRTFENVEGYMSKHGFLGADKKKVREYLKMQKAVAAMLTRKELLFIHPDGIKGRASRELLGIQDDFQ